VVHDEFVSEKAPHQPGRLRPDFAVQAGVGTLFLAVAAADFWTGYELWFSIFYLAFIAWATWFLGRAAGVLLAVASVAFSLIGDLASGARYSSAFVPWWNVLISLCFYLAMVMILMRLKATKQGLERLVNERTAALRQEMVERERLERALLEVSEREQRSIGHELHDSLCQHLTGTAMAAQVLTVHLENAGHPRTEAATQLVAMIEQGIDLSRSLARGLAPLELDAEGLVEAVRELAATTRASGTVCCNVEVNGPLRVSCSEAATQLFRIAQEAVRNSLKHARPAHILISLGQDPGGVSLEVTDDGEGLPMDFADQEGMGMRIMRYRAALVGALFEAHVLPKGTRISVRAPAINALPAEIK